MKFHLSPPEADDKWEREREAGRGERVGRGGERGGKRKKRKGKRGDKSK